MFKVYIIKSLNHDFYYKGMTNDLERRFNEHNLGKCKSTKNYKPFELVYFEEAKTRVEAREIEKKFKSGYFREIIRNSNAEVAKWQTHLP